MPQIPSYQAVGVASPSGRVIQARASGSDPVGAAVGNVASVIDSIAKKKYKDETALAYATAKNEHLRNSIALANKVQEDPDYNKWQSTFDEESAKSVSQVSRNIRDPDARQRFEIEAQAENTRTSGLIAGRAHAEFKIARKNALVQSADANLEAALSAPDEGTANQVIQSTNDQLSAAKANGIISANEHTALGKDWMERYAKARVSTTEPEARLKALQAGTTTNESGQLQAAKTGSFVDYLPLSERAAMIKETQREIKSNAAADDITQERAIRLADKQKKDAAEAARSQYITAITDDPTKVDPHEIAHNKALQADPVQLETTLNFLKSRLTGDDGVVQGPEFQAIYDRITADAGDPNRITEARDIYRMVGPGKPLGSGTKAYQAAQKLDGMLKEINASDAKGDFSAGRLVAFDRAMRERITRDQYGDRRAGAETSAAQFFNTSRDLLEKNRKAGVSDVESLDAKSPNFIGRDVDTFVPKPPKGTNVFLERNRKAAEAGTFSTKSFDTLPEGAAGRENGIPALRAAVAANPKLRAEAMAYAIKRGWSTAAKPKAAPEFQSPAFKP